MAAIKTAVAKSRDIKDAALNLNVKAYEVRRTLAAVWNLAPTRAEPPAPEAAFSLNMVNEGSESVVGAEDERVLVDKVHFAPGGKYRCKFIAIALIKYTSLIWLRSDRIDLHPLRIPTVRTLGYGYWLAY